MHRSRLRAWRLTAFVWLASLFLPAPAFSGATFVRLVEVDATATSAAISTGNFSASVTGGHLMIVRIFYKSSTRTVLGVTDSKGNTYAKAVGPTTGSGGMAGWRMEIWYAKNIAGGSGFNVTATFDASFSGEKSVAAHEYAGLDTVAPLDVAAGRAVSAANASSGSATTTSASELIFGAALYSACGTPGSGFSGRSSFGCNVTEDRTVTTAGSYAATFTNSSQSVIAQMATFRLAGQTLDTDAPSVPGSLSATAVSTSQINLTWTASTDNVAVSGYQIVRDGVPIAAIADTAFSDAGLAAATSYAYAVRAVDAAGNVSALSATVTETTLPPSADTAPPSVPSNLRATPQSSSAVSLSWSPSADDVAVTGYRLFRNGAQIGTTPAATFLDSGLAAQTTYSYAVAAFDAAGNVSALTAPVTVSTLAAGSLLTYTTSFPLTENPISEGGRWINGGAVGLDWTDVSTTPGLAIGRESGISGYDDATAVLAGQWSADQTAEATVYSVNQNDSFFEEVELRLRTTIAPHRITGYEVLFSARSSSRAYVDIVRWNGPLGSWTLLDGREGSQYGIKTGDVVRATVVGNVITAYVNGVRVVQVTDSTYTDGSPGIGFYLQNTTGVNGDYGFSSFTATSSLAADSEAPSVPTGLAATPVSASRIDLAWQPSTDDVLVAGYQIFRNGILAGTSDLPAYASTGLNASTAYTFAVTAVDASGNVSAMSAPVTGTTLAPADTTPPSAPGHLTATAQSSSAIALSWSASTDDVGVAGYRVYRGPTQVATTAGTTFVDSGLNPSTAYSYQVFAFDAANHVSAPSAPAVALTAATSGTAGTVNAVSCGQSDVRNALSVAASGDAVLVPAGACTWTIPAAGTPAVAIASKSVTLQGAGIDRSVIDVAGVVTDESAIEVAVSAGESIRITGFTLSTTSAAPIITVRGTTTAFRIDHNAFTATIGGAAIQVDGAAYGVADHNTFHDRGILIADDGNGSWQRPLNLGGADAVYVEDNTFDFDLAATTVDSRNGARYVFRHNSTNAGIASQSTCGSGARGTRRFEIYANTIAANGAGAYLPPAPMSLRSGTGVVFDNTIGGSFVTPAIVVDDERSDATSCAGLWAQHPSCDGLGPYDGNRPGTNGYLCRDQIGASADAGLSTPQTAGPMFAWGNTAAATGNDVAVVAGGAAGTALHVQKDRDFFNAANPDYVPYAYPHPLALTADVTAPTVAMAAPLNGATLTGTSNLVAVAADDTRVAGVQFLLDGVALGAKLTTAPYALSWNTTQVADGAHVLSASAWDDAGNVKTAAPVAVTVSNNQAPAGESPASSFAYVAGSVTGIIDFGGDSSATLSVALHQSPGSGDLLVCAATWQSSTATATMSDPNNGAWTPIGSAKTGGTRLTGYRGQMFYVSAAAAAPTTVTLTLSTAVAFRSFECAEFSYVGTLGLDGTPQYSTTPASGAVATVSGLTTSNSSDLVFAACLAVDTSCAAGTGFTSLDDPRTLVKDRGQTNQSFKSATGQTIEFRAGAAAGAQSATFKTGSKSASVILGLVAF